MERITFDVVRLGQPMRFSAMAVDTYQLWSKPWALAEGGARQLSLFK